VSEKTAVDYSTLSDAALNFEIAKRLGRNDFADVGHVEHCMDCGILRENWAQDANAALELAAEIDYSVSYSPTLYFVHMHGHTIDEWGGKLSFLVNEGADTFPRAICECWLKWKDAQS
jgi:hypothetical protein